MGPREHQGEVAVGGGRAAGAVVDPGRLDRRRRVGRRQAAGPAEQGEAPRRCPAGPSPGPRPSSPPSDAPRGPPTPAGAAKARAVGAEQGGGGEVLPGVGVHRSLLSAVSAEATGRNRPTAQAPIGVRVSPSHSPKRPIGRPPESAARAQGRSDRGLSGSRAPSGSRTSQASPRRAGTTARRATGNRSSQGFLDRAEA